MMLEVRRVVVFVEKGGGKERREHVVDTQVFSLNNNSLRCTFIILHTFLHTYHEDSGPAISGGISIELVSSSGAAALSSLSPDLSPVDRYFTLHTLSEGEYNQEKMDKNKSSLFRTCLDPSQSSCDQWLLPEKWKFQHNLWEQPAAFRADLWDAAPAPFFFVQHISPQTLWPLGIYSLWCVLCSFFRMHSQNLNLGSKMNFRAQVHTYGQWFEGPWSPNHLTQKLSQSSSKMPENNSFTHSTNMFGALTVLGTSLGTNHSCNYILMDINGVGSMNKGAVYLITTES